MTIRLQAFGPVSTQIYAGTLTGGERVHEALATVATRHAIHAGIVHLLGGLSSVSFTAYDFITKTRHPAQTFEGVLEIVGGHGTISLLEGDPSIHLHLMVAQRDAHGATFISGGHCSDARAFAVEFVLHAFDQQVFSRVPDELTGLALWHFPPF